MIRAFNIEGLVRLQNYMGGKTLSDAQFFAVLNADVVEMIDGEESTTKRRYFRIAENDESITFSCILGSSQQQMVVTKATKQLDVTTTGILSNQPGSITSEMLADGAVTREKIASQSIDNLKLANGSVSNRTLQMGAVTSEKLAPGLDVSGLFFILPEGTQFPYTLTEDDKTKLANARFLIIKDSLGVSVFTPSQLADPLDGFWLSTRNQYLFYRVNISNGVLARPEHAYLGDASAVHFTKQTLTAEQKAQARANIESADAGLFFTLPEGTQFPYTLTEDDKTKLANARFLIIKDSLGVSVFTPSQLADPLDGFWLSTRNQYLFYRVNISNGVLARPEHAYLGDASAVHFTKQTLTAGQKTQARTNIGAAEDPNTSGDSPATLEEPIL